MKKRLLSWLLILALCLSLLPAAALAEDAPEQTEAPVVREQTEAPTVQERAESVRAVNDTAAQAAHTNHPICGATHTDIGDHTGDCADVTWTAWDGTSDIVYDSETKTAYVYLSGNAERTEILTVAAGYKLYLCLNGYSLTKTTEDSNPSFEGIITIYKGAQFTLCDCRGGGKITHAAGKLGRGVRCGDSDGSATFAMFGGEISGNRVGTSEKGQNGAGVETQNAIFNMYGGRIINNEDAVPSSYGGGGVCAHSSSSFTMYGGEISGNTSAGDGGGVFVIASSFTMKGGSITNNKAEATNAAGGGAALYNGRFELSGGTITGNSATEGGGLYYYHYQSAPLTVSGSVNITGNKNAAGADDNVYLTDGNYFMIGTGGLNENARIGVTYAGTIAAGKYVTVAYGANNGYTENAIFSDKPEYTTLRKDGSVRLYNGLPHEHPICGKTCAHTDSEKHTDVTWTALTSASGMPFAGSTKLDTGKFNTTEGYILPAGHYYLSAGLTLDKPLLIKAGVSLCLNGQTLTVSSSNSAVIIDTNCDLTLCDCSAEQTGKITHADNVLGRGVYMGASQGRADSYNGSFTMYGGSISGNSLSGNSLQTGSGSGVYMCYGTFNMHGGKIVGNRASDSNSHGGGVCVNGGTFNMTGGTISNNTSKSGGAGVYVNSGTFDMSGNASVSDNTANGNCGGGVYVNGRGSSFTMNGNSTISGNTVKFYGGGVYVTDGTFTMESGTITGNNVLGSDKRLYSSGGGVYVNTATFNMTGGSITGNNIANSTGSAEGGGGVYVKGYTATMTVSGDVKIKDNWKGGTKNAHGVYEKGETGSANNFYLFGEEGGKKQQTITIGGVLASTARIGVTTCLTPTAEAPIKIATGATGTLDYTAIFTPDVTGQGYTITLPVGEQNLYLSAHQHSWNYTLSADGKTITAACTDTTCTSPSGGSVTIVKPLHEVYRDGKSADATMTPVNWIADEVSSITYKNYTEDATPLSAAPTNAGTYTASITVGGKTATVTYEIGKATPQASDFTFTPPTNPTYDGGPKTATVEPKTGISGMGEVTVNYYDEAGQEANPINVGTYTVKINVAESGNYNSIDELTSGDWTFTILQADYTGQKSDKTIDIVKGRSTAQTGTLTAADFFPAGQVPADAAIVGVTPASGTIIAGIAVDGAKHELHYVSNTNITATADESYAVTIATTNYADIPATLTFHLTDKQPQTGFKFAGVENGKVTKAYGTDTVFTLAATGAATGSTVTYESTDTNVATVDGTGKVTIHGAGDTTITATAAETDDYAEGVATYELTVSPKTLTANDLEFTTGSTFTKAYDGGTTCTTATVQIKSAAKVNQNDVLPTVTGTCVYNSKDVKDADTITFTPDAITTGNYSLATTETVTITNGVKINKRVLTVGNVTTAPKTFDGYDNATFYVTNVALNNFANGETLVFYTTEVGGDYGIHDTKFDSANAGARTITGTVALLSTPAAANYTFEDAGGNETTTATFTADGEIVKANARDLGTVQLKQRYTDTDEKEYQPDYAALMPANAGKLTYDVSYEVTKGTASVGKNDKEEATGKLTYQISAQAGAEITWTFTVRSDNYKDSTFKLVVTITDRDKQENFKFENTTITKTYGDPDFTVAATGAAESSNVTYTGSDDSIAAVAADGTVTIKKAGTVTITATAAATRDYDEATASCTLIIDPAKLTVTALDKKITVYESAPDLTNPVEGEDYTVTGTLFGADTLTAVTMRYSETPDTSKVGEYIINITATLANYDITTVPGTLTIEPSKSTQRLGILDGTRTVPGGTIETSPKNALPGQTVTITVTPQKGYELGGLTVRDIAGGQLTLTRESDREYTFVMPDSSVSVTGYFVREGETMFRDVPADAYYYEAVQWAVETGVTGGVGDDLFAPDAACTRAQIVTFLWRAAGSPEPQSKADFTDVPANAYYVKAVAWALENGITKGTSATTFSPDDPCTRAQAVTFLARALSAKAEGTADFLDVIETAYYAKAVAWASENSVTSGVGGKRFAPDQTCTRAQIVTFLYRAYNK